MYIVRDGKVAWSYTNTRKGELGDCSMLSNGNIVFSRQFGASEITPDKKIVWDYDTTHEFKTVNGIPGHGGAIDVAGPVVANGMVYAVSGYPARGALPGNVLIAFSTEP